jgi:uncharacterized protein YabE (DUF348 family)
MRMALADWCTRVSGTRTGGKGVLFVFLLIAFSLVVYPQVAAKEIVMVVDGIEEPVVTRAKTVGQVLEEKGLYVRSNDQLIPSEQTKVTAGMEIHLQRAVPVFVQVDGQMRLLYSSANNAIEFLHEQGISLGKDDRVLPGLNDELQPGSKIYVLRVGAKLIHEEIAIPFKTVQKSDPELTRGRRKVVVEGKEGTLERIYEVIYVDGEEESRTLMEEKQVSDPVTRVVHVGTKEAPVITASARDGRMSQIIEGIASWYGAKFHGRKTAYGDTYDMNKLTAAFPSREMKGKTLRVTYLKTGRSVDVIVNDYGPHVSGRVIDLSMAAARAIGLMADGIGKVRIEIVK